MTAASVGIVIWLDKTKPIYLAEKPILRPSPLAQNSISKCPTVCPTELDLINELTTTEILPNLQFFVLLRKKSNSRFCSGFINYHVNKKEVIIVLKFRTFYFIGKFRKDFNLNKKSDS